MGPYWKSSHLYEMLIRADTRPASNIFGQGSELKTSEIVEIKIGGKLNPIACWNF